jgi:hypothetical protein
MFEFTAKTDPPASRPHFAHGRLISGAIVPFLVLYLRGIQVAVAGLPGRAGPVAGWVCVAAVAGVIAVSEISLTRDVFLSAYNWFHLP